MPNGCIIWTGGITGDGYGCLEVDGDRWLVHRLMWIYHNGRIPDGHIIRHEVCGNRACRNEAHLKSGTQAENIADAMRHGTLVSRVGVASGKARYTEAEILEMRDSGLSLTECVRKYGGCEATVHNILTGKTWKHIGGNIRGKSQARGERVGASKLTVDIVREIKQSSLSTAALARQFQVTWQTVNAVRTGKYWSHVTSDV